MTHYPYQACSKKVQEINDNDHVLLGSLDVKQAAVVAVTPPSGYNLIKIIYPINFPVAEVLGYLSQKCTDCTVSHKEITLCVLC